MLAGPGRELALLQAQLASDESCLLAPGLGIDPDLLQAQLEALITLKCEMLSASSSHMKGRSTNVDHHVLSRLLWIMLLTHSTFLRPLS